MLKLNLSSSFFIFFYGSQDAPEILKRDYVDKRIEFKKKEIDCTNNTLDY